MKANEAPKDIYILPDERNPTGLSICWYEAPYRTGAIEYIRTDAFIEKAVAFLKERVILKDSSWYIEGQLTLKDKMIEDFRNYMKGE